jgi:hypothetical protein
MCTHTKSGNSLYMNLISVQVNYVQNMNLTFKYPQLHNILSQTYVYIAFLTGNNIKETRSSIYWHIILAACIQQNDTRTWCVWTAAQPQMWNQCTIHYSAGVAYHTLWQSYKFIWTVVQFLAGATPQCTDHIWGPLSHVVNAYCVLFHWK